MYVCTNKQMNKRMKIENQGVGQPLLGPAKNNKFQRFFEMLRSKGVAGQSFLLKPTELSPFREFELQYTERLLNCSATQQINLVL